MEAAVTRTAARSHTHSLSARVMKAMGVFGGVQALQLLCGVVRTKLVAVWIGAAGVGLFGIFLNAVDMVATITRMGIDGAAVRDVAACGGDASRLAVTGRVVRRWGLWVGLLGALAMLVSAPWMSTASFGDTSHTWLFMLLAIAVLFQALTATDMALLQGMGRYKRLARANLWGSLGGVAVSAPLFYWLRIDSIVPSMLAYSAAALLALRLSRVELPEAERPLPAREVARLGKPMVVLGIYMTLAGFLSSLSSWAFISWLNLTASTAEAGFFQAGFTLFSRYVGMILAAIAVEFYPRLSGMAHSPRRTSLCVAHEASLVMWLVMPGVVAFTVAAPWLVPLLYDSEFLPVVPMITIGIAGTVCRALSWCMAFTMLARGDGRAFLITETTSAALYLGLNILFFKLWGLIGLGWAYVAWYVAYTLVVGGVYRFRYHLRLPRGIVALALLAFGVALLAAAVALLLPAGLWWLNLLLLAFVAAFSFTRIRRALKS